MSARTEALLSAFLIVWIVIGVAVVGFATGGAVALWVTS